MTDIIKVCQEWNDNPLINPRTSRTIKKEGPVYKKLRTECASFAKMMSYLKSNVETCNPAEQCRIIFLDVGYAKEIVMQQYARIATNQKKNKEFIDIFPWEKPARKEMIAIIAATNVKKDSCSPTKNTQVCGWLTAYVDKTSVYIYEISTRRQLKRTGDLSYKGVGKCLFDRLVKWSEKNNKKYIYLYPLNSTVESVYKGWGFVRLSLKGKDCEYMFYKMKALPGPIILKRICRFTAPGETDIDPEEKERIEALTGKVKQRNLKKIKIIKENNRKLYESIIKEIEAIICMCDNDDQCKREIGKYLQDVNK